MRIIKERITDKSLYLPTYVLGMLESGFPRMGIPGWKIWRRHASPVATSGHIGEKKSVNTRSVESGEDGRGENFG